MAPVQTVVCTALQFTETPLIEDYLGKNGVDQLLVHGPGELVPSGRSPHIPTTLQVFVPSAL